MIVYGTGRDGGFCLNRCLQSRPNNVSTLTICRKCPNLATMKRLPQLVFIALLCSMMFALGCQSTSKARQQRGMSKIDEARRLEAQGLSEEALAAFNAALQENPKLAEAELGIGDIYRQ